MSECAGDNCTHPDCVDRRHDRPDRAAVERELRRVASAVPPEKWAAMNRAERRAAMRGKRK